MVMRVLIVVLSLTSVAQAGPEFCYKRGYTSTTTDCQWAKNLINNQLGVEERTAEEDLERGSGQSYTCSARTSGHGSCSSDEFGNKVYSIMGTMCCRQE